MKGANKCIRLLTLCITFLLSSNLFSNANAINLSIDVTPTDKHLILSNLICFYSDDSYVYTGNTKNYCQNPKDTTNTNIVITKIRTSQQLEIKEGYYYRLLLSVSSGYNAPNWLLNGLYTLDYGYKIIDFKEISEDIFNKYYYCSDNGVIQGCGTATTITGGTDYSKYYELVVQSKVNSPQIYFQFGIDGNQMFISEDSSLLLSRIYWYQIDEFKPSNAAEEMNEKDNEDRNNLETQQSSTSTDSNSSQQQAQSTGTTLLAAFSSFVSAITSSSPSNCKINMDMGNLDLGLVDFCTLSPPAPVQTIASIFMILFCVPLSIATARKVISLFRSFQK